MIWRGDAGSLYWRLEFLRIDVTDIVLLISRFKEHACHFCISHAGSEVSFPFVRVCLE